MGGFLLLDAGPALLNSCASALIASIVTVDPSLPVSECLLTVVSSTFVAGEPRLSPLGSTAGSLLSELELAVAGNVGRLASKSGF